jgi:hypothetical protein
MDAVFKDVTEESLKLGYFHFDDSIRLFKHDYSFEVYGYY